MDRLSRESERCFGLIVETSNEGVWLCDSAGQTTFVNAKIVQMMGFSRNELLGKPISAFLSADGPHAAGATLSLPSHERAENGEVVGEWCFLRKDGTQLWADTTVRMLLDADGNVAGIIARLDDATQRREARRALRESERQYRLLADAMPQIVFVVSESGSSDFRNRTWYDYSGLSPEESCGDGWLSIVHPDDIARCSDAWRTARANGEPYETQLRLRRAADGMYRWFASRAEPLCDDRGQIVRWVASCTDIHDLKLANKTQAVLDHLGHMISIRDAEETLEYISPSWARFAGTTEVLHSKRQRARFVHPDDVHLVEALIRASHAAPLQIQQNEVRVRGADGYYRWFLTRSVVLPESAEMPRRRLNTLIDIDDLKRAQEALARSAAELSHRARHDPLTNLANRSSLIDRLAQLVDEARSAGTGVTVLYLDIDHFKKINDTFGHNAGDALLTQTAARINSALRSGDIASRFGGDEFVLACAATCQADVVQIAERVRTAVRVPLELGGQQVAISCSIGISVFPDNCLDADALIQQADAAMYTAKQSGRDGWCLYNAHTPS